MAYIEEFDENVVSDIEIDLLLHCATHYGRRDTDAVNTIESNLLLPLRLLALLKKTNKKVKFINTDTILDKHINVYSLSKSQFKEWMIFFSAEISFINVRLEHFYGPLDDSTKFVSYLIQNFLKNIPELNLTNGEQYRYFTYIDDIVSAFELVIDSIDTLPSGLTQFDVSADDAIQLKSFVNTVKRICSNEQTRLNFGALPYREGESMKFTVDTANIQRLGWRPKITLEEGLRRTIEIDRRNL